MGDHLLASGLELSSHVRPRVPLLHQAPSGAAQRAAAGGIPEQCDDRVGELRRIVACTKCVPGASGRPSAPTLVDTTAFPIARASQVLSRRPPPTRSGTTYTAPRATYGRTSFTVPVMRTPGTAASRCTRGPGFLPTTVNDASGAAARMRGKTTD